MYRLSRHAAHRIKRRRLRVEWLLAALNGRRFRQRDGYVFLCDPQTRCTLVVAPEARLIVTAFKMDRETYRRMFERTNP